MSSAYSLFSERRLLDQCTQHFAEKEAGLVKRVYLGFDPTSDSLHLGNYQGVVALRWLQMLGWTPVVLIGGGTGMIGDPSGKSAERTLLEPLQLAQNTTAITELLKGLLAPVDGLPSPIFVDNRTWLSELPMIDFLRDVGKHFRVNTMLTKQSVRQRLSCGDGISYTEFSYQILQAYDFFRLNRDFGVTVQIGGSDQWGNITAGCDFVRRMCGAEVHGITWPLLLRSDGRKFGKSESGAIWLDGHKLSPFHFFQYLLQTPDSDIERLMMQLTFLPLDEIQAIAHAPSSVAAAQKAQQRFAAEVTRDIHGQVGLKSAQLATAALHGPTFDDSSKGNLDDSAANLADLPHKTLPLDQVLGAKIFDLLVVCFLTTSKAQGRRLIQSGGVYLNRRRVQNVDECVARADLLVGQQLQLGIGKKKRMVLVAV